jgi:hypothetical protein
METNILEVPHPHRLIIRARDNVGAGMGKCDKLGKVAFSIFSCVPIETSHSHTEPSNEPEIIWVQLLENVMEWIEVWPFSISSFAPLEAFHTCIELLNEPEMIQVPSLENAIDKTEWVWPFSVFSSVPVEVSHTCVKWSFEPGTIQVPSWE